MSAFLMKHNMPTKNKIECFSNYIKSLGSDTTLFQKSGLFC